MTGRLALGVSAGRGRGSLTLWSCACAVALAFGGWAGVPVGKAGGRREGWRWVVGAKLVEPGRDEGAARVETTRRGSNQARESVASVGRWFVGQAR